MLNVSNSFVKINKLSNSTSIQASQSTVSNYQKNCDSRYFANEKKMWQLQENYNNKGAHNPSIYIKNQVSTIQNLRVA